MAVGAGVGVAVGTGVGVAVGAGVGVAVGVGVGVGPTYSNFRPFVLHHCSATEPASPRTVVFSDIALSPMLVTLAGMITLIRLLHSEKAYTPMLVTLSGMLTLVRLLHL